MFDHILESRSGGDDTQRMLPCDRSWKDILTIVAIGVIANILLIANPGFYSHDELDWQNRIVRNDYPWSFGLGNFSTSPFFRLLGTIFISASLRLPIQPVGAHLTDVLLSIATACLVYRAVALFRPDRAVAAAILFMLMPGFAYSAAWVAAGFDIQYTFWGVAYILCSIIYWRGGHPLYLIVTLTSFVIGLGCKETALSIPICAALVLFKDRHKINRRRVAVLAAFTSGLIVVYLALGATRILRMSTSGEGGYRVGDGLQVLKNLVAYFGFPFAPGPFGPGIVEIQAFPFWDPVRC
jgi:hypothetical protein